MTAQQIQAEKWLKRASSSYHKAKLGANNPLILLEDLCFDAQQSTEKALKAILVYNVSEVPRTHSIGYLLKLIKDLGIILNPELEELAILTEYAVQTRYPGDYEPVTEEEYFHSIELSHKAIAFAKDIIYSPNLFNE